MQPILSGLPGVHGPRGGPLGDELDEELGGDELGGEDADELGGDELGVELGGEELGGDELGGVELGGVLLELEQEGAGPIATSATAPLASNGAVVGFALPAGLSASQVLTATE
jgi:hypothetical protein